MNHFPNIYQHCLEEGYDVTKEPIPVVPAQHYFMGGIHVDAFSKTTMDMLYAAGETSCNGVHGANRLASNSLLESLVFAKRAARQMTEQFPESMEQLPEHIQFNQLIAALNMEEYRNTELLEQQYKTMILEEMEKEKESDE